MPWERTSLGGSCCIGVWGCCLGSPLGLPSLDPSFLVGSRLVLTIIRIPYIRTTQSEVCGLTAPVRLRAC